MYSYICENVTSNKKCEHAQKSERVRAYIYLNGYTKNNKRIYFLTGLCFDKEISLIYTFHEHPKPFNYKKNNAIIYLHIEEYFVGITEDFFLE
jgi:hypothetical protein